MFAVCLVALVDGGEASSCMAQQGRRLTSDQAIAAARRNGKPGSAFTVLREILADDDTRRIGNQALEQAQVHKVDLYGNGILVDFLRSGGFLLAETEPQTNNVIALHLVSLGAGGDPTDIPSECHEVVKLTEARDLVKDTTEFVEQLYSTPASGASSLESRFDGGHFPECDLIKDCTFFAIPTSFLKLGADQSECREITVLYDGQILLMIRYAVSMPSFSADPVAATRAAADEIDTLQKEFLRDNHMDPDFNLGPENIRSREQLLERIDLVGRLNKFMEEGLKNDADPALVKANISVAAIPLEVGQEGLFGQDDKTQFVSGTACMLVLYWQRLPTGGFAVKFIYADDLD
jgi:hypothetical protein